MFDNTYSEFERLKDSLIEKIFPFIKSFLRVLHTFQIIVLTFEIINYAFNLFQTLLDFMPVPQVNLHFR